VEKRILTGDRPTGRMHLGHLVGTLQDRVRLQDSHRCYFLIADLHTLTTRPEPERIREIPANVEEMLLDYLAVGIDPERSVVYLQSAVPQVYELNLLLEMLVTVPRLSRIPSLKEMARAAGLKEMPFGLLGYPVLQAADILLARAHVVPVGRDNQAHVELAREIARRFNGLYGRLFPEPGAILGKVPSLVGTDGKNKMSSSLDNAIYLSDPPHAVREKVFAMYTDPARVRADVPGRVEGNPVFRYHDLFNSDRAQVDELKARYRAGRVGDVEVKDRLAAALNRYLEPVRERRERYRERGGYVWEVLRRGTFLMREEAEETMRRVREATGLGSVRARVGT
jgi:tryptophanyl-tRNA synthetase